MKSDWLAKAVRWRAFCAPARGFQPKSESRIGDPTFNMPRDTCPLRFLRRSVLFSAWGGICTAIVNYQGILGKGGLFVTPPLEDCLTMLTGSSIHAETGRGDIQLIDNSVADWQWCVVLH